jgi:hypothetical protein
MTQMLGAHAMVFSQGGAFHPHSYQLWLPVLAIGAGWTATALGEWEWLSTFGAWKRFLPDAAVGATFLVVLLHEMPNYALPPDQWAIRKYGPGPVSDRDNSKKLDLLLASDETVFLYGNGAAPYFYTEHRPTTMTLWSMHMFERNRLAEQLGQRTLAQLQSHPPDVVVVQFAEAHNGAAEPQKTAGLAARWLGFAESPLPLRWDQHPIYAWIQENYRPWPDSETFRGWKDASVLIRAGSHLEHRLAWSRAP